MGGKKKLRPFSIFIWCIKFIRFSNIRNPGRSQTPSLCTWRGQFALKDYKLPNYSQTLHWYYSFQSNKLTNDTTQVTKWDIFKGFSCTCRVFSLVKIVLNLSIWSHSSFPPISTIIYSNFRPSDFDKQIFPLKVKFGFRFHLNRRAKSIYTNSLPPPLFLHVKTFSSPSPSFLLFCTQVLKCTRWRNNTTIQLRLPAY